MQMDKNAMLVLHFHYNYFPNATMTTIPLQKCLTHNLTFQTLANRLSNLNTVSLIFLKVIRMRLEILNERTLALG